MLLIKICVFLKKFVFSYFITILFCVHVCIRRKIKLSFSSINRSIDLVSVYLTLNCPKYCLMGNVCLKSHNLDSNSEQLRWLILWMMNKEGLQALLYYIASPTYSFERVRSRWREAPPRKLCKRKFVCGPPRFELLPPPLGIGIKLRVNDIVFITNFVLL